MPDQPAGTQAAGTAEGQTAPQEPEKPPTIADVIAAARQGLAARTDEGAEGNEGDEGAAAAEGAAGEGDEGAGEGEGEGAGTEAVEEGEVDPDLVVELPARREGGDPLKIVLPDKATAEALRRLNNGYARAEQVKREREDLRQREAELADVEAYLKHDPVGFMTEQVRPELQMQVFRAWMLRPEFAELARADLEEYGDENVRARRAAELGRDQAERRHEIDGQLTERKQAREKAALVRDTIHALVPLEMPEDEARMFVDDCLRDAAQYLREHTVGSLREEDVVGMLERRLRHYGIQRDSALAALSSGQPTRRSAPARTKPAGGTPEEAREAGAKLKQAGAARRAAAAVPGAGAGARPTRLEPPAKQGVKERVAWARKLLSGKA